MMIETRLNQDDKSNLVKKAVEIRFRCPHCQKLYRTTEDVFEGAEPEFDCASCEKPFILTNQNDQFGLFMTKAPQKTQLDACPKCSHMKPLALDECPSCGIVVSKYLELQKLESPALYELNKQWQQVVLHFDQDQFHQDFLNKCHQQMALNFAYQKYADLQKTIGADILCDKYMTQIHLRLEQQIKSPKLSSTTVAASRIDLGMGPLQILFMSLGIIGMFMLIYNKYVPTFPNFNGLVLSLTIISFAIGLFTGPKAQMSPQKRLN